MTEFIDGPATPAFTPVRFRGKFLATDLDKAGFSPAMMVYPNTAPSGKCVLRGIPFKIGRVLPVMDRPVTVKVGPVRDPWLVFAHSYHAEKQSEEQPQPWLTHVADYVLIYDDGKEVRLPIRYRREITHYLWEWGHTHAHTVPHSSGIPVRSHHEQAAPSWGQSQTRVATNMKGAWTTFLWAWKNRRPKHAITAIRFEPLAGAVVISAITSGKASVNPLRWESRQKAVLKLPRGVEFDPTLSENGLLSQVQLDLGVVISATPRPAYPSKDWETTYNNKLPEISHREILVEYTAHRDARFHLWNGKSVPVEKCRKGTTSALQPVRPANQLVTIRVRAKGSRAPVAVKLHLHGTAGEYLAPVDRHRIPNPSWFEDYAPEFSHCRIHHTTYIDGETVVKLPLGTVYMEVSKGFEIRPVRKVLRITKDTRDINIDVTKVLRWREKGWVTADTHVHFLSPPTARIEGAGEGVNIVNLLASQWGELMTNVGDFDGKTTFGSKEAGGDGEYLVRVGTENRQGVMGHISLVGYEGSIINPMCSGGPGESALGDPVEVLLTEWAKRCKEQNGVVVIPHFPFPRLEHAATIASGNADGIEMTSWGDLYSGISPYSLADWYRYLNCGCMTAAVGGTDKMSADTAVGTVRTYAQLDPEQPFTYDGWKEAVRKACTFVTYGPLMEMEVDGQPMGSRIAMTRSGGTVAVTWKVASVTVPMSKVELIVNGVVRDGREVDSASARGTFRLKLEKSSWIALLVRGRYPDKPEMIAAHSSPVMIELEGIPVMADADAMTILEQIEGALAFLDALGTRAETKRYKAMRMVLTSAHRDLHNRMHQQGHYHKHSPVDHHEEHGER